MRKSDGVQSETQIAIDVHLQAGDYREPPDLASEIWTGHCYRLWEVRWVAIGSHPVRRVKHPEVLVF